MEDLIKEGFELLPSERLAHVIENGGLETLSPDQRQELEAAFRNVGEERSLEEIVVAMQEAENPLNAVA
ncbi:MAG: hypothetical protein HGA67_02710 [Candidatus Yonathbacteria bacterium]|nr:hypothetical protein [Candidatus Yonathbacteria bacterium]